MSDSPEVMIGICNAFNEAHPIGTEVICIKDLGEAIVTKIKYPAEVLGGHTPVVWLEGIRGAYDLSRVHKKAGK